MVRTWVPFSLLYNRDYDTTESFGVRIQQDYNAYKVHCLEQELSEYWLLLWYGELAEKMVVLSIQPANQARVMPERVGKRVSLMFPQSTWRRWSQSGWTRSTPSDSRGLQDPSHPRGLSNLQKLLSIVLFQTLAFHDAQGQTIVTTFSVEKDELMRASLLKQQAMCHVSQECIHFINFCSRGQGFN